MASMEGVVTLVQEGRFLLQSEPQGEHHLFVLSHRSGAEPAQLAPLQRAQTRVRVDYEDAPDAIAKLARSITLVKPAEALS